MSVSRSGCSKSEFEILGLNPAPNARLSERVPMCFPARLSYESDDGSITTIKVRVVNMSTSGVLVEALRSLPVATRVRIQGNELLVGTAYVRRFTRSCWRFKIGLEFARAIRNRY
jgi:hypothetical protein